MLAQSLVIHLEGAIRGEGPIGHNRFPSSHGHHHMTLQTWVLPVYTSTITQFSADKKKGLLLTVGHRQP